VSSGRRKWREAGRACWSKMVQPEHSAYRAGGNPAQGRTPTLTQAVQTLVERIDAMTSEVPCTDDGRPGPAERPGGRPAETAYLFDETRSFCSSAAGENPEQASVRHAEFEDEKDRKTPIDRRARKVRARGDPGRCSGRISPWKKKERRPSKRPGSRIRTHDTGPLANLEGNQQPAIVRPCWRIGWRSPAPAFCASVFWLKASREKSADGLCARLARGRGRPLVVLGQMVPAAHIAHRLFRFPL